MTARDIQFAAHDVLLREVMTPVEAMTVLNAESLSGSSEGAKLAAANELLRTSKVG